jgi:hypothetical protein
MNFMVLPYFLKKILQTSLLFLFFFAGACAPAEITPPPDGYLETVIAGTLQALPTLTPASSATETATSVVVQPSATLWPVETDPPVLAAVPTLTHFPTITSPPAAYIPVPITPGPRQGDYNYACRVLSYNPVNYYNIKPGQKIQVAWRVKNDGAEAWDVNSIDIAMLAGINMAIGSHRGRFDIHTTVLAGSSTTISFEIQAPDDPGEHSNNWSLARGNHMFCRLILRVHVVK